ncbi:MAG TPA: NADPH:quinone reductase [Burkholderiaceae bacterium]|nr:NADPH:quinone reductase [Burkholderiaceae bacterium]
MLAAFYTRTGPARDVLEVGEIETPAAGPGEVRVRLAASGVNPSDVKTRGGVRSRDLPFPRIVPHSDGAGVIEQVGDGVPRDRLGERVWVWNAAWGRPSGTAAQYVVLPAQQAVPLPANTSFEAGACLGIPALTAYHAVHCNGGVAGKTVLVAGGAGAVGHYAVQFAKIAGARLVVATVSGAAKAALARDAGADVIINYRTEDLAQRCLDLSAGVGVDRIIELDLAANLQTDLAALRRDGEITVFGSGLPEIALPFFPAILKNVRFQFFIVYNLSDADRTAGLAGVTALLNQGRLKHNIDARLPLARIADAHELVESGKTLGNVVIDLPAN